MHYSFLLLHPCNNKLRRLITLLSNWKSSQCSEQNVSQSIWAIIWCKLAYFNTFYLLDFLQVLEKVLLLNSFFRFYSMSAFIFVLLPLQSSNKLLLRGAIQIKLITLQTHTQTHKQSCVYFNEDTLLHSTYPISLTVNTLNTAKVLERYEHRAEISNLKDYFLVEIRSDNKSKPPTHPHTPTHTHTQTHTHIHTRVRSWHFLLCE